MTRQLSLLATLVALAATVAWATSHTAPARAQMGPTMGQPLDQLSGDAFDRAFLEQMTMQHGMAVVMARPVVANAAHQELRDLGASIIADQTREIAQMRTWGKDWYGMDIADPVTMMDGMQGGGMPTGQDHQGHGMGMPMGQGADVTSPGGMPMDHMGEMSMMADLWKLPAPRLEAVFLSMMIPHHEVAISMARLVPDRAAHQELKDLAGQIISSQSAEIGQMNTWLADWYGL